MMILPKKLLIFYLKKIKHSVSVLTRALLGPVTVKLFESAVMSPFTVTLVNDDSELIEALSKRSDYSVEEGDPAPAVYKDGDLIGELHYAED